MLNSHAFLLILGLLFGNLLAPLPQTPPPASPLTHQSPEITFGDQIRIQGEVDPTRPVARLLVFLQAPRGEAMQGAAALDGSGFDFTHNLKQAPLPPFSEVSYWFGITYADGEIATTPKEIFRYDDNRSNWNHQESELVGISWVEGDAGFAQQALDSARLGLEAAQNLLPSLRPPGEPTQIYIYPSARQVQEALQLASYTWVAGHADPWLNSVLVSIPAGSGQKTELQRQIPHELMHIWLYRLTESLDGDYQALPIWLNEGLATLVERASNTSYPALLVDAHAAENLIPMLSLCKRFPSDPSLAIQAYAQSASFTRYLQQNYGSSGLEKLVQIYADGLECERGVELAFGVPFAQVEQAWITDTFGQQTQPESPFQATPFLVLLGVILLVPLLLFVLRRFSSPAVQS